MVAQTRTKPKLKIVEPPAASVAPQSKPIEPGDVVKLKSEAAYHGGWDRCMTIAALHTGQDGRPWADLVFTDHQLSRPFVQDRLPLCVLMRVADGAENDELPL